jgi:glyoxylase-like metal-dependent hydrolase (beta-lactamase superfamily II)
MVPDFFDEAQQKFIASIHTWVVKTRHHIILIDSCGGNHKNRPSMPRFHQLDTPFLERLAEAGVTPESVDFVMCTHLHVDHCGWNTRLKDGRWVPTFPNARYIFSKAEYEFWTNQPPGADISIFEDSVLPVIESQQAQIIDGASAVGDDLFIRPTPGHTVGHVAIELIKGADKGIFSGDIMHQPLQVYRPHWNSTFCDNADAARASRLWLLEHAAEQNSTVFTAHFANSSAGRVSRHGDKFDWKFV